METVAGIGTFAFLMIVSIVEVRGAPIVSGATVLSGENGSCPLLATDVVLSLSQGVKGAYLCTSGPDVIGLAVCHRHGRRSATLADGAQTTTGIVYTMRSDGGNVVEVSGCPLGESAVPDDLVPSGARD